MKFVPAWTESYIPSYIAALREGFHIGNVTDPPRRAAEVDAAMADMEGFLARLRHPPKHIHLPDGQVIERPASVTLWWVDDLDFIGAWEVRPTLTSAVYAAYGGHISMGIRPSRRGARHGNQVERMIRAGLVEAGRLGLRRGLVCVRDDNRFARLWNESVGCIFIDAVPAPYAHPPTLLLRFVTPPMPAPDSDA